MWESCPLGTFSTNEGLWNDTQCEQCTPGFYCDVLNATSVTGPCAAGYYCTEGMCAYGIILIHLFIISKYVDVFLFLFSFCFHFHNLHEDAPMVFA